MLKIIKYYQPHYPYSTIPVRNVNSLVGILQFSGAIGILNTSYILAPSQDCHKMDILYLIHFWSGRTPAYHARCKQQCSHTHPLHFSFCPWCPEYLFGVSIGKTSPPVSFKQVWVILMFEQVMESKPITNYHPSINQHTVNTRFLPKTIIHIKD